MEWRNVLVRWLRASEVAGSRRWDSLVREAGTENYSLAQRLLDWLLCAGWLAVVEEKRHGAWWPTRIEFLDPAGLRQRLGLPDPGEPGRRWQALGRQFEQCLDSPELAAAIAVLYQLPAGRAADRGELLLAIDRWRNSGRSGTRRDFAHFARGGTKAITAAEWRWLEDSLDLAAYGIERHTPLLLVAAPLTLESSQGLYAIGAAPDFSALTPETIAAAVRISGSVTQWRLIENRTSFERVARNRRRDVAVVWLPGYPPHWWRKAMDRLLRFAPAPAEIACDPDPAGIAIALEAAQAWEQANLPWRPWRMDTTDLATMSSRRPLTPADRELLADLKSRRLPLPLAQLAQWMENVGEKGEQEGFL